MENLTAMITWLLCMTGGHWWWLVTWQAKWQLEKWFLLEICPFRTSSKNQNNQSKFLKTFLFRFRIILFLLKEPLSANSVGDNLSSRYDVLPTTSFFIGWIKVFVMLLWVKQFYLIFHEKLSNLRLRVRIVRVRWQKTTSS